jgi:hypothetical protein
VGLRRLFQRKAALSAARVSTVSAAPLARDAPRARQEELQAAWVELTEAAKGSRVTSFHAYTRTGRPWTDDPEAVRAVAATLREFPAPDSSPQAT